MGVKFNKDKAKLRLNAAIDELSTCTDKDRHAQLIAEVDSLHSITQDESKEKIKDTLVKTASVAFLMTLTYAFDRSGVLNKAVMSFIPKHI